MAYLKSYKELVVWQKSILLVKEIFVLTDSFPKSELYGLISQVRRAAVSIPSNIAEGYGRRSAKEYSQFYSISYGSALELETQLIIAQKLGFSKPKEFDTVVVLLEEVLKMLNSMTSKMRQLNARS